MIPMSTSPCASGWIGWRPRVHTTRWNRRFCWRRAARPVRTSRSRISGGSRRPPAGSDGLAAGSRGRACAPCGVCSLSPLLLGNPPANSTLEMTSRQNPSGVSVPGPAVTHTAVTSSTGSCSTQCATKTVLPYPRTAHDSERRPAVQTLLKLASIQKVSRDPRQVRRRLAEHWPDHHARSSR